MTLFSPHGEPLQNPYEILGLERGATDDQINKSFKRLMLKLHPDKQPAGQSEEEAAEVAKTFHNVMDAKSFLLDSEHMSAKRAYDSKLSALDRRRQQKLNIPSFDKNTQCSGRNATSSKSNAFKNDGWKSARRFSDCTHDSRPHFFKNAANSRRASSDDCSTTSQSSSGDDVAPANKSNNGSSRKPEKQKQYKEQSEPRHSDNVKSSRNHSERSIPIKGSKQCKKASSFSESYSSFFKDNEPKRFDSKPDKKVRERRSSMDQKRPSLIAKSEKPPSQNDKPPRVSISSSSAPSKQPNSSGLEAHQEAKQRITNSIDALAKKFRCPLTKEIINDPMTDFEGNSYERDAVLKYLETHCTSPVTGTPLYACHLTSNTALKEKIRYTMELKKTLDVLGEAQKKEMKNATKQHATHHSTPKVSCKHLRESIDSFITDLNSGSAAISMTNLDDNGTTSFSYLGIKVTLQVSEVNSFTAQTFFDHNKRAASISARLVEWNKALQEVGLGGKLTFRNLGGKFTFSLSKKMDPEEFKSRVFRYSIEYYLEFAIKLHNVINVTDLKTVGKVRLSA